MAGICTSAAWRCSASISTRCGGWCRRRNPLKPVKGMAPFAKRLAGAAALAKDRRAIRISPIEAALHTSYTADTITVLGRRFPRTRSSG